MQELSGWPRDTSAPQPEMFLFSKCAFLQDTNNVSLLSRSTAKTSSLSPCSFRPFPCISALHLIWCKYSWLRSSHIFFRKWLFHRLTFLISRKIFLMFSLSFQAPVSGSVPSPFPSYLLNYRTWVRGYISRMVITRSAILLIIWRSGTTFTFSRSSALNLFLQGGR